MSVVYLEDELYEYDYARVSVGDDGDLYLEMVQDCCYQGDVKLKKDEALKLAKALFNFYNGGELR